MDFLGQPEELAKSGKQIHAIKAAATLAALGHYKGAKDETALAFSAQAVEYLAKYFAEREAGSGKNSDSNLYWLCCAAKCLGLFQREKPSFPDLPWTEEVQEMFESGELFKELD
jgi:hypothetical protein